MSEYHRQNAFGPPSYTDVSASGSSSGLDPYTTLDTGSLYHEQNYRALPHPLQIAPQDIDYADGQFAYVSQSSQVSPTGLQYTSPVMARHPISQHYEHEPSILEELNGFSPITPNYSNIHTYRTPYPDSTATSTSSATSPDPNPASLITDPVIIEADEEKRKRNQAASARFRHKKKQREQQLMEMSREMQERTRKLEAENEGLKKENMFLKKLLVEKVDHMSEDDREMLKKVTTEVLEVKK